VYVISGPKGGLLPNAGLLCESGSSAGRFQCRVCGASAAGTEWDVASGHTRSSLAPLARLRLDLRTLHSSRGEVQQACSRGAASKQGGPQVSDACRPSSACTRAPVKDQAPPSHTSTQLWLLKRSPLERSRRSSTQLGVPGDLVVAAIKLGSLSRAGPC
jgi:hypothetical protein